MFEFKKFTESKNVNVSPMSDGRTLPSASFYECNSKKRDLLRSKKQVDCYLTQQ